jgi:hypothetical protein
VVQARQGQEALSEVVCQGDAEARAFYAKRKLALALRMRTRQDFFREDLIFPG